MGLRLDGADLAPTSAAKPFPNSTQNKKACSSSKNDFVGVGRFKFFL